MQAQSAKVAEIWLWQVGTWKAVGRMQSHSLTVTQMEFSHDDNFLLTVSRDRHFSIFSINQTGLRKVCHYSLIVWSVSCNILPDLLLLIRQPFYWSELQKNTKLFLFDLKSVISAVWLTKPWKLMATFAKIKIKINHGSGIIFMENVSMEKKNLGWRWILNGIRQKRFPWKLN